MFCYQCEQTFRGSACVDKGVCGKDAITSDLQDHLLSVLKSVARYAHRARAYGVSDPRIDRFALAALFATGTNVNFDASAIQRLIEEGMELRSRAASSFEQASQVALALPPAIPRRLTQLGTEITGLQELVLYGLKGTAAYAEHARSLGSESNAVYAGLWEVLCYLAEPDPTVEGLLGMAMKTGELNYGVMEMLDAAHTRTFGHPTPASVRMEPIRGKAIVVSGHDLADLSLLLQQTAGTGINVYTHGEMLPAHGYPNLRSYAQLAGNYGGAWMNQEVEFDRFPGAILMTSNCIQQPRPSYKGRMFTSGPVRWPGVTHIQGGDFTPVIEAALAAPGFEEDGPDERTMTGFGHNAVMSVAGQVIEAVKSGAVRHFYLIGGCDGARPGRNYYTEFAQAVPEDCLVLTLACGKYRFNRHDFGTIGGLPRLLDMGQCNDAYSAIQVALALAKAFDCGVNDLPLSLIISWYEQKAVAVLLTLLFLGVKNMRIGPTLPAFVGPETLKVLVDSFGLTPIGEVEQDLAATLA